MKLSKIEKRIIEHMDMDSRIPFSRLGKLLKTSEQRISYTVQNLQRKNIISGFYTLIDYSRLGVLNFRVYFKVNYLEKNMFDKLINYLTSHPNTLWVASCSGKYDLIATFAANNPSQFNKLLRKIMGEFSKQLQNYSILTTIVIRYFGRKHLYKKKEVNQKYIGGDRLIYQAKDEELKLLKDLSTNSRITSVELARKINVTPKTIINKINKLKQEEVILGYKTIINLTEVGYITNLLLVKYHNISINQEEELVNYLVHHPNVITVVKTLGEWDIEIEIEAENINEFRKIEIEIRSKFSSMIQQTETISLYKAHKKTFFPDFIVE